jgi:hypothetical protein
LTPNELEIAVARIFARTYVDANGCWVWEGNKCSAGYGNVKIDSKQRSVHRLVLEWAQGSLDKQACHTCDNRPCCNPSHLWEGTQLQNIRDAYRKGRINRKGENNGGARLNEKIVRSIRRRYIPHDPTHGCAAIARDLGVSTSAVNHAINYRSWKEVSADE